MEQNGYPYDADALPGTPLFDEEQDESDLERRMAGPSAETSRLIGQHLAERQKQEREPDIYDAIIAEEQATWTGPEATAAPTHAITFQGPDECELMSLDVPGVLPIPAEGDVILLHWQRVTVVEVSPMHYGRTEDTGQPRLHTTVHVAACPRDGGGPAPAPAG